MMEYAPYELKFKEEAVTSRARMRSKLTYFVRYTTPDGSVRVGEVPVFQGLSAEDTPDFEQRLAQTCCEWLSGGEMPQISSIRFGLEQAVDMLPPLSSPATIIINGLVWMGTKRQMYERIRQKLEAGFRCVKLKIGGIDFEEELELLRYIRSQFPASELELRLDANGAFTPDNALHQLQRLSAFRPHSIEQPIKAGQWTEMAGLCARSPIPIALDEELIGVTSDSGKVELLETVNPQFIILKPALCGGFEQADSWIAEAEKRDIGWWATSALESNIGLSAIARWVAAKHPAMPQGLGTGALYTNNFPAPLQLQGDRLTISSDPLPIPELPWRSVRFN